MQSEILTMIQLQKRWDSVLHGRSEIASAKSAIIAEEKALVSARHAHAALEKELLSAKTDLKSKEIDLLETESLLEKLQTKRFDVQSSRELKAIETEIETAAAKKGTLEESVLSLMDSIAAKEEALALSEKELSEKTASAAGKTAMMKERVTRFEGITAEHESAYKEGLETLSPKTRSRFGKMITSSDGKGIVPVEGENCGGCRFTIPFDIRRDASKGDLSISCPHCGKYIYAPDAYPSLS